jgi:hypothetical protein
MKSLLKKLTGNNEEAINRSYDEAIKEVESGRIRSGLMARAKAEVDGDDSKAKARYLKLLAALLKEEQFALGATNAIEGAAGSTKRAMFAIASAVKSWLVAMMKVAVISLLLMILVGANLFDVLNPAANRSDGGAWLGGAMYLGVRVFGVTVFLLAFLFMLDVCRRNWPIVWIVALLPAVYFYSDTRKSAEAAVRLSQSTTIPETKESNAPIEPPLDDFLDEYHKRVSLLRSEIVGGNLNLVVGDAYAQLPQNFPELDASFASALEGNSTWWLEKQSVYVHLVNTSLKEIAAIEFTMTSGRCERPAGKPISTILKLKKVLPPKSSAVVVLNVPRGVDPSEDIQCGVISRSWSIEYITKVTVVPQKSLEDSGWTPGPAKESYGLPPRTDCPVQINSRYYRDCDGSTKEGTLR